MKKIKSLFQRPTNLINLIPMAWLILKYLPLEKSITIWRIKLILNYAQLNTFVVRLEGIVKSASKNQWLITKNLLLELHVFGRKVIPDSNSIYYFHRDAVLTRSLSEAKCYIEIFFVWEDPKNLHLWHSQKHSFRILDFSHIYLILNTKAVPLKLNSMEGLIMQSNKMTFRYWHKI